VLLLCGGENGLQLLRQLLVRRLQLRDFISQARQILVVRAQFGKLRALRNGDGFFELIQLRLQIRRLLFRLAEGGEHRVLLAVRQKEKTHAGEERHDQQPNNPAFKFHGLPSFAPFRNHSQTPNEKRPDFGRARHSMCAIFRYLRRAKDRPPCQQNFTAF
jgi:hypothetical protein